MQPISPDAHEAIFTYADAGAGLSLVVAIHSTRLGPAIGGTRYLRYGGLDEAMQDARQLSRAMSYKCALAGLPAGGGKAVILADDGGVSPALLSAYGKFLNRIGDLFATGEDVGFSVADCEQLRAISPFVAGTASRGRGNPAIHTGDGAFYAIRATTRRIWGAEKLSGLRVAVQGLGGVGMRLCERLHAEGVDLIVSDARAELVQTAKARFGARAASLDRIHRCDVDIWSPCALGGVINDRSIAEIGARAIVGAANNQLSGPRLADDLQAQGIFWAPDFLVSAGGVLSAFDEVCRIPGRTRVVLEPLEERLQGIGARLLEVLDLAENLRMTPLEAATTLAERRLAAPLPV